MKILTSNTIEKSSCTIDKKVRYDMFPNIHIHVLSLECISATEIVSYQQILHKTKLCMKGKVCPTTNV